MKKNSNRGSANILILAVIIFGALIYFNVDLRSIVGNIMENPGFQKVWNIFVVAWTGYLVPLSEFLWGSFKGLF
ncbi:MAG: hypothetical protein A2V96_01350 [Candidatus Yonathbacteria bacterium RBG_16_43_6]|nr:MAG: hypothetical protein A2658_02045 [Candidatus Yonathbacteria bacterium RIFCSPHIGHO2_01_FULL_44_19]OHA80189.1 MAG: hypothetical protein A2V96_01350 [Candidatus Yonathbacteria bacterium RBG_16_43_6]